MLLDDLVGVIETLKERIATHGAALRENETRTRMALIDPLLKALGWDTSDPAMVLPEYDVSGRKADYALLDSSGSPSATVEAKKLGEPLASHRMQMLNYSNASGVEFAGLTDGDKWELYEVFKRGQLEERRILDVSIADTPVHEAALKLLLLWRPNLASGQPVAASTPVLATPAQPINAPSTSALAPQASVFSSPTPVETDWKPLTDVNYNLGDNKPIGIRFSGAGSKPVKNWVDIWFEVCEWLTGSGKLCEKDCPVPNPSGTGVRVIANTTPQHPPSKKNPNGNNFAQPRQTSTGIFVETNHSSQDSIRNAKFLLTKLGVDPAIVELRFG